MENEIIEKSIRESVFPNPVHKEKLRERLLGHDRLLDLEELASVAGGAGIPNEQKDGIWEPFPDLEDEST